MKKLTLNDYQEKAMSTCMPSCENISYMLLNLVGEVGEFASKVAKEIRKENMCIGVCSTKRNEHYWFTHDGDSYAKEEELKKEAGDILWQLAGLCHVMGWTLEDVGLGNLEKLAARKAAGTIDGNGDGIIREK